MSDLHNLESGTLSEISYPSVMVGIPAYNEEDNIKQIVTVAKKYADIVVVANDASTDNTEKIATEAGAVVITHKFNKGYGGGCLTLFKAAQKLNPDILVMLDADGQHNPEDIERFVKKITEGYDVIVGSRFLDNNQGERIPLYRLVGIKTIDKSTNFVTKGKINITDILCGYRAFSREAYNKIHYVDPSMQGSIDMIMQLSDENMKFTEIPVVIRYDLENTSKDGPIHMGYELFWSILQIAISKRPLVFFGIPGFFIFIVGIIALFVIFGSVLNTGVWPITETIISTIILVMGLLLGITAMILFSISQMLISINRRIYN